MFIEKDLRFSWWLWALYGFTVVTWARKFHNKFGTCSLVPNTRNNWPPTVWERDYPWWDSFKDWCYGHNAKKALIKMPLRHFVYKLFFPMYDCPHCNHDKWLRENDAIGLEEQPTEEQIIEDQLDLEVWCSRCGYGLWEK
jgi:hypothetical protein